MRIEQSQTGVKKMNKGFVLLVLIFALLGMSSVVSATPVIKTYVDSDLKIESALFEDGMPVFFTVSNLGSSGGVKNVTISNGKEIISTPIYDNGTYPDKVADDGIYTGHFRVSTIMTIDIPQDPVRPKLVDAIYLEEGDRAVITLDDETREIGLMVLFDVKATAIKNDSVTITWTTSIPSTGYVEYGLDSNYGNKVYTDNVERINNQVELTSLSENTTYHYRVVAMDIYGKSRISEDKVFKTPTVLELEDKIKALRTNKDLPKTYYVSLNGNDYNDGLSIDTAWRHISYAVSKADVGDIIYVLEGTYEDEHVSFPKSGIDVAPIKFLSYPQNSQKPVLDGLDLTGTAINIGNNSYIEISGFKIVRYGTGIASRYTTTTNLFLHNFEMENINNMALILKALQFKKVKF